MPADDHPRKKDLEQGEDRAGTSKSAAATIIIGYSCLSKRAALELLNRK